MNYIALLACWASFSSLPRPMSSQAQTGLKPKRRVHWESLVALLNSGTRGPQASRASRSDRKRSQAKADPPAAIRRGASRCCRWARRIRV
jgi:hypothetical protein